MKRKFGILVIFLLIILSVAGYFYYNKVYVYNFVDKERILNNNFEIDKATSDSVRFTEKGLGYNYILKTFTLQKIKKETTIKANFLTSESIYPETGYKRIYKDEDVAIYLKKENSGYYNYHIDKYDKEKERFIQVTFVSEEEISDYKIDDLIFEAESYLKYWQFERG